MKRSPSGAVVCAKADDAQTNKMAANVMQMVRMDFSVWQSDPYRG